VWLVGLERGGQIVVLYQVYAVTHTTLAQRNHVIDAPIAMNTMSPKNGGKTA
jgi:hypothetical protein